MAWLSMLTIRSRRPSKILRRSGMKACVPLSASTVSPESSATVMIDLKEIGPSYYFAPPSVFEGLLTSVMIRMEDAGAVKRWLFHRFMDVARRIGPKRMDGAALGLGERLLYALGNIVIYGPLRNTLGLSRVRVAYTAGEAIGPEVFLSVDANGGYSVDEAIAVAARFEKLEVALFEQPTELQPRNTKSHGFRRFCDRKATASARRTGRRAPILRISKLL